MCVSSTCCVPSMKIWLPWSLWVLLAHARTHTHAHTHTHTHTAFMHALFVRCRTRAEWTGISNKKENKKKRNWTTDPNYVTSPVNAPSPYVRPVPSVMIRFGEQLRKDSLTLICYHQHTHTHTHARTHAHTLFLSACKCLISMCVFNKKPQCC